MARPPAGPACLASRCPCQVRESVLKNSSRGPATSSDVNEGRPLPTRRSGGAPKRVNEDFARHFESASLQPVPQIQHLEPAPRKTSMTSRLGDLKNPRL